MQCYIYKECIFYIGENMNVDWMKRLNRIIMEDRQKSVLSEPVVEIKNNELSEHQLLLEELNRYATIQTSERDLSLPGLGSETYQNLIAAAVADFKSQQHSSRVYKPDYLATIDDIMVVPLRPELFGVDNYQINGLVAGNEVRIVPQEGLGAGDAGVGEVTAAGQFKVDPEKVRIIYTDWVEYELDHPITALRYDVDEDQKEPFDIRKEILTTDMQMIKMPSPEVVRVQHQVMGKVEFDGDTMMTPYGVAILLGEDNPDLT